MVSQKMLHTKANRRLQALPSVDYPFLILLLALLVVGLTMLYSASYAQSLYDICTPVSGNNVAPGDLVFFKGTYDTPGVSHVGIYVGNNRMIHCGDPISYTNLNSSYWQSHFYTYGRLP